MAYTILNEADSFSPNQSELDSVDIDILVAGIGNNGARTGGLITAQGTPDMTVAVAAGSAVINGGLTTWAAGNVTIATADGTNPRIDLIVVNNAEPSVVSATAGTAAAQPVLPSIPANSVVLATIYVEASDTTIETNKISDRRVLNAIPVGRLANGTDGELITWNSDGRPTIILVGTSGHILTSGGAGSPPTFQAASSASESFAIAMAVAL